MFFAFVALVTSCLIFSLLILHKIWEIKRGRSLISRDVLNSSDIVIKKQMEFHSRLFFKGGKRGFKILLIMLKDGTRRIILTVAHYLHDRLSGVIIKIKGKGMSYKKNEVSFFLKRMEEYKNKEAKTEAWDDVHSDISKK
ncbi:MAG: hypothetical protein A3G52_03150 [Candidatus Taylorbacteria bacterium RIFCSPLOWO2_12_FULL_43_20]|uniref:Uncharacterized protein n=1 Tax=Candidatus Taylorbacteria bacterium RIFCSPLOWO2_12_FULL_43_20 TaxID=1802332 RepID=A0A1G2P354_9BACT|nr:MAG: hypothetical protein A2825_03695 [Candidatus Taylorbacteria bacterium RIFCSPHIGHO2_01_FULL_43_120]OHA22052.1 MAG: hypothetical protein A3B98_04080 [Candidatus Taylorbacteria bacterium RIFCSPHIGHO2_02_FULL_43_55]OHA30369.1 MAG: hypothetical protein A3E92_00695 [Candidatus Taylorbacteria bacterium RIFCSPHIGHO2_12_FULL_42_34]OHA31549.1 MAG: hypothetical protein A3B09_00800 [Candidatus Taylorbacteria bacterium RIFCSPLOWO2_01_FULL_43_83]OHA39739.1 MAG: hypothetical protein A3H58_04775 [Candi